MKIIDLTHELIDGMSHCKYDPSPSLKEIRTVVKDGFKNSVLTTTMHIGTHIDAPAHMIEEGKRIIDYPLEKMTGKGCIFDCENKLVITLTDDMKEIIQKDDIVILYTGFDAHFNEEIYYNEHPVISEELAEFLINRKVKCLAMDFFSPDKFPFDIHKILLGNDILLVENIKGAKELLGKGFEIFIAPLKMNTGGALARVFAQIK